MGIQIDRYLFRGFAASESGKEKIQIDGKVIKGEWVEGEPINKGRYIMTYSETPGIIDEAQSLTMLPCVIHKVIPSTVGEYAGLKDKCKSKIFENDTVKVTYGNHEYIGKVVFNENTKSFEIWRDAIVGCHGEMATHTHLLCMCTDLEIIGTIFDVEDKGNG